jgi:hypothetical protein
MSHLKETFNATIFEFDDLPLPTEVEREYLDHAGDGLTAIAWLADLGIDSAPSHAALIQYGMVWNPETGRFRFLIYAPEHVGPKCQPVLAVPIIEDGVFIDLLLLSDDMSFETAACRAQWLGTVAGPVVRLHAHPMDWLESGCTAVCHIEPIGRESLADLRNVTTIECNDIHTALEAWDFGFGADDDELARFSIDDSPAAIRSYSEDAMRLQAVVSESRI